MSAAEVGEMTVVTPTGGHTDGESGGPERGLSAASSQTAVTTPVHEPARLLQRESSSRKKCASATRKMAAPTKPVFESLDSFWGNGKPSSRFGGASFEENASQDPVMAQETAATMLPDCILSRFIVAPKDFTARAAAFPLAAGGSSGMINRGSLVSSSSSGGMRRVFRKVSVPPDLLVRFMQGGSPTTAHPPVTTVTATVGPPLSAGGVFSSGELQSDSPPTAAPLTHHGGCSDASGTTPRAAPAPAHRGTSFMSPDDVRALDDLWCSKRG